LNQEGIVIATKLGVTADLASKKLFPKATLKLFKTEADAGVEVMNKRADVMVYDQPYIAVYSKQNSQYVTPFLEPFTDEPLGMAVRKKDKELLEAADAFVKKFKTTEKYTELYNKYFVDMPWVTKVEN
jgi:polar amino acid transport system substrate-binding protein